MAKRLLDLSIEDSEFRKKIKLENKLIWNKIKNVNEEFDINQHELEKFLLIFHILIKNVNSEESLDWRCVWRDTEHCSKNYWTFKKNYRFAKNTRNLESFVKENKRIV